MEYLKATTTLVLAGTGKIALWLKRRSVLFRLWESQITVAVKEKRC